MRRLVWLVALTLSGCAAKPAPRYQPEPVSPEVVCAPLFREAEGAWRRRETLDGTRKALAAYEKLTACHPQDAAAWVGVARASALMAGGYLEVERLKRWVAVDDLTDEQMALYEKGMRAGEAALAVLQKGEADDREAVYWTVINWHGWATRKGFATVISQRDHIRPLIERLAKRDETFYFAAAHRFWGIYYAIVPSFAGGDLDRSEQHFQRALDLAPDFFANRVEMAEHLAIKRQNRQLFYELLQAVLSTPHDRHADWAVEQRLEHEKAELLLQLMPRLFAS